MMVAGLNASELIELALLLVAVGALSGFLAGVFGIGGGAILVPVFYECFRLAGVPLEVRMPLCVGTSLAIIIPTSIRSFRAHYARGAVDMEILKQWWLPIVIGVVAGSVTARYAPERLFKIVFVMVAWSAAAPSWSRYSTNASGSLACRWRRGCRCASAPRLPSSFRPRSAPGAPTTTGAQSTWRSSRRGGCRYWSA